ncbi:MAG: antitoxin family protein [Blastocatellales bacterium]
MQTTLRATYSDGVFIPLEGESLPELPEAAEVEITVRAVEPAVVNEADRAVLLREIAESMKANTFTGDPPRFTREELHERR